MSVIKQISVFDGTNWNTDDIGANAGNIDLTTNVAGQGNLQAALSKIVGTDALKSNRALVTNGSGIITPSAVTSEQLNYLSGVTEDIQTQFDSVNASLENKAPFNHWSSTNQHGIATTNGYGHTKLANNLTTSAHQDGLALDAYQGYVLKQNLDRRAEISNVLERGSISQRISNTEKQYVTVTANGGTGKTYTFSATDNSMFLWDAAAQKALWTFKIQDLRIYDYNQDNITVNKNTVVQTVFKPSLGAGWKIFGCVGVAYANASSGGQGGSYAICKSAQVDAAGTQIRVNTVFYSEHTGYSNIKVRIYVKALVGYKTASG